MKKLFLLPALLLSLQLSAQTNNDQRIARGNDYVRIRPDDSNPTLPTRLINPYDSRGLGKYDFIRVRPEDQNPQTIFKPAAILPVRKK